MAGGRSDRNKKDLKGQELQDRNTEDDSSETMAAQDALHAEGSSSELRTEQIMAIMEKGMANMTSVAQSIAEMVPRLSGIIPRIEQIFDRMDHATDARLKRLETPTDGQLKHQQIRPRPLQRFSSTDEPSTSYASTHRSRFQSCTDSELLGAVEDEETDQTFVKTPRKESDKTPKRASTQEDEQSHFLHNDILEHYLMRAAKAENRLIHLTQGHFKMAKADQGGGVEDALPADATRGLRSPRAMLFLFLWYFFSLLTLFLNRIILTSLGGDPFVLSTFQMVGTMVCGALQMHFPCGMFKKVKREGPWPPNFYRNMILVGACRFGTVFFGLLALEYVEISFTETVKSSAPIFTVLIARIVSGEKTGLYTQLSLIPIMGGLALCSTFELSFNMPGFVSALSTNVIECLQFVFSKMLICGKTKYNPAELQYYTSLASVIIQIPFFIFLTNFEHVQETWSHRLLLAYICNGIFLHYQTICAFVLMGYVSPVTQSVANTVKRALLIWLSVLFFGNTITFLSGFGTTIVFIGVLCYNRAKEFDHAKMATAEMYRDAKVSTI